MNRKDRWIAYCEVYDSENYCGFGFEATIQVKIDATAELLIPAEPDLGIMYDDWKLDYTFKPTSVTSVDENYKDIETFYYEDLSQEQMEKITKVCLENEDKIKDVAHEGPGEENGPD